LKIEGEASFDFAQDREPVERLPSRSYPKFRFTLRTLSYKSRGISVGGISAGGGGAFRHARSPKTAASTPIARSNPMRRSALRNEGWAASCAAQ
jgi:hypothetical protein